MKQFSPFLLLLISTQIADILTQTNPDDVGTAISFQNQDLLGQYNFGYSEGHPSGATFRRESGDALGNKVGSFGLRDADGRIRVVRYVADSNGFRAEVTSNEPGVAPQDPASASIVKPAVLPVPATPVVPLAPVARFPVPLPPPVVPLTPDVLSSPPISYNYILPAPVPAPPPPPPSSYLPPRFVAPIAAPVTPIVVPGTVPRPVPKTIESYPPPPPPPFYYNNLVQGNGYLGAIKGYTGLFPPFPAVPPQFNYLNIKSPAGYQTIGTPL